MSMKTYIVKSGDTFGQIVLKAMKDNKDLSSEDIERANGHIKKFSDICVDDTIYIPSPKPKATSLYAAPTEGKCGNEFTYVPVGKKATMASVSGKLNGKSTPNLEPNQTYVLEREKIEESQQGSLEITYNGKALPLVKDMSPFKEQIGQHKDVKVSILVMDKSYLTPAIEVPEFRSPDNDATMTPSELSSNTQGAPASTLEVMGIKEERQIVAMDAPSLQEEYIPHKKVLDIESDKLTFEQKKKIVHDLLASLRFDGLMLPSALAMGDLLTGTEKAIVADAIRGLKSHGWNGKFYVNVNKAGRTELVFKGWAGLRKHLNFTHILTTDARVSALGIAAEVSKGSGKALVAASNPFKGAPFGITIVGFMDVTEWVTTENHNDNLSDLFAMLGVDAVKFGLASAAGVGVAALIISSIGIVSAGAIIITVLGVGVAASYVLEMVDAKLGVTQAAKDGLNDVEKYIEEHYKAPQKYISDVPAWMMK